MIDLRQKVAVVTGGAGGIGLGIIKSLLAEGASVAIADIDLDAARRAADSLAMPSSRVLPAHIDVTDPHSWSDLAQKVEGWSGAVSILCNNAGVTLRRRYAFEVEPEDWNWIIGVNLGGAVNGVRTFAPRMIAAGQGGHILNTASMLGYFGKAQMAPYVATKFALTGYSESLRMELAPFGIGVSLLSPGVVATAIRANSRRHRPSAEPVQGDKPHAIQELGMSPDAVGRMAVEAIMADRFYVFTHPEYREAVVARGAMILESFGEPAENGYREDPNLLASDVLATTGHHPANRDPHRWLRFIRKTIGASQR